MEKKISTFTEDEKETMEKFNKFEAQINANILENESISSIEYYRQSKIIDGANREMEFSSDLYLVKTNQDDGKTRTEIYAVNANNLIGYVDEEGNIEFVDENLKSLGIKMTLEDFKEVNVDKLLVKSEELTPEELEEYLQKEKEGKVEESEDTSKDKETKKMEKEVEEKTGKYYDFSYYKEIKSPGLGEEVKSAGGKSCSLAIDKITGRMMIIDTKKGYILEGTEIGKTTRRTAITINNKGEKFERQTLNSIIKTTDDRKEIGIRLGNYGEPELYTIEVTPCAERVATRTGIKGQKDEKFDLETKRRMNDHDERHEIAENYDDTEKFHEGEEINEYTEIKLKNGTITTLGKEASKAKVSVDEFVEKYKIAEGENSEEKIDNVQEEIEEEYGISLERKH